MSIIEREHATTVTPAVTTRDVLHRAANLIEEFGWTRGIRGMPHQAGHEQTYCILGSVCRAAYDFGLARPELVNEYDLGGAFLPEPPSHPNGALWYFWNDEPGRTKEDVVAKLREAAESA